MRDENSIKPKFTDESTAEEMSYADRVAADLASSGLSGEKAPKFYIQTFGCQQNVADSEKLAGMCCTMGYERAEKPEDADLILVNTCAVREHAEKKALSIIGQYKHIKDSKPETIIGVGGCMVTQKARADKLKNSYPYVSFTFDTGAIQSVPRLVYSALKKGKRSFVMSENWEINEGMPSLPSQSHIAWLSIMYGCNNFCSYCIVPYVRGRERSRSAEAVIEEAKQLIERGAKDITLLGQNVNSYDGGMDIAELMHKICALDGDFRLRFMTSHPKDASDRLFEAIAEEEKIVKHLHLPIQSGSDRILKLMNRKYTRDAYLEKIEKLKSLVPDISLTSDIIVGFPGETEEDFEDTLDIMKKVRYDMVFSFIYSPRTGTPAAKMDGQIPREISAERMKRLLELETEISNERNERFLGRTMRILIEGESKNDSTKLTGKGDTVRPVHFPKPENHEKLIGTFANVRIKDVSTFSFEAEII